MKKIYSKKSLILRIILTFIIVLVGVLGFVFQNKIESLISGKTAQVIKEADFKMYVIDVGQGDSILLEFSDSKNMLIDCGKKSEAQKLNAFLQEKNIKTINYLVYTHPDEDHIGGGVTVFENYNVEVLYRPKVLSITENEHFGNPSGFNVKSKNGTSYDNSIMIAYDEDGCEIRYSFEGEEIVGSDYYIKFLSPDEDNYNLDSKSNSYSAVLMVEVNNRKVLLTGDAETDVEKRLVSTYSDYLSADILKVAHHGSKTATSSEFLNCVTPNYALISAGIRKGWDMPHEEVLERLKLANVQNVYTTNSGGTIAVGISDSGKIGVSQTGQNFKLDMPIFVTVLVVCLLLVWGIVIKKSSKKSSTKIAKKKNSKK